jgi:dipeptidase E
MKRLLLISSSNVYGYGYLDQPEPWIRDFLGARKQLLFVPFAGSDRDAYARQIEERFGRMDHDVTSLHESADARAAVIQAEAIFVGGGNTFRLLQMLYSLELVELIRERVLAGTPYIGSSAGSNIAAPTIRTTNDMPIVQPPTFDALHLVEFQLNPHYLDAEAGSTHMGETREERLLQYLEENERPVIGLREGSALLVENDDVTLLGEKTARLFRRGQSPCEVRGAIHDQLK